MNEANVKRNETKKRGEEGWEGEGKERKRSERKSEANVLPNGVSISIMTALFPFGLVRAPHGYVYTQGDRVDANNWRSSILSVGIAHSETSFASAFVHPERESTDTRARARLLSLFSFSLSLSLSLSLPFLLRSEVRCVFPSIHARCTNVREEERLYYFVSFFYIYIYFEKMDRIVIFYSRCSRDIDTW